MVIDSKALEIMKKLLFLITAILLLTVKVLSQQESTKKQIQLHRRYNYYYTFEVSSHREPLSYREWLKKKKLVDISGVDYVRETSSKLKYDTALYKAIWENDSINTPPEGREFFYNAVEYFKAEKYPDALRYATYAINTNSNFAFAYFLRATIKFQLKLRSTKELVPDLTMACNLGITDACTSIKRLRNCEDFIKLWFYGTWRRNIY